MGLVELLRAWATGSGSKPAPDEAPREPEATADDRAKADAVIDAVSLGVRRVGAWTGWAAFDDDKSLKLTIDRCKWLGLRRLDVIVNDFSAKRAPVDFEMYRLARVVAIGKACRDAGIDMHMMSWLMPHRAFIDDAAKQLRTAFELSGAKSIQWDAEEPWTQAQRPMNYVEAAALIAERFAGVPMGVNGIMYASKAKLGPLAAVCDYVVPQCYSTDSQPIDPAVVVRQGLRLWREWTDKPIVVGLAAYRQVGIPIPGDPRKRDYTSDAAMRLAFAGAEQARTVSDVIYWSLGAIADSRAVAETVRSLASKSAIDGKLIA